jgi:hypothetical protein
LCNNPIDKEPKLHGAKHIVDEWLELDEDALGTPQGTPPPPLINMQRYGPPRSYPQLKITDLQMETNDFSQENLIGEGALGRAYKAEFSNGKILVVKVDSSTFLV